MLANRMRMAAVRAVGGLEWDIPDGVRLYDHDGTVLVWTSGIETDVVCNKGMVVFVSHALYSNFKIPDDLETIELLVVAGGGNGGDGWMSPEGLTNYSGGLGGGGDRPYHSAYNVSSLTSVDVRVGTRNSNTFRPLSGDPDNIRNSYFNGTGGVFARAGAAGYDATSQGDGDDGAGSSSTTRFGTTYSGRMPRKITSGSGEDAPTRTGTGGQNGRGSSISDYSGGRGARGIVIVRFGGFNMNFDPSDLTCS